MLMWLLMVVIAQLSSASIRSRRQAALAVNQQEIPITLRYFEGRIAYIFVIFVVHIRCPNQRVSGQEQPFDVFRSIISCLVPGIREYLCLGPRIEILKKEQIGLTERKGAAYGYVDGVDVRLLKPLTLPMINDKTEVGDHWGAVVDVTDRDGVVEFGERLKVFKALQLNNGGITEWDRHGAGVDIGSRASAADDLVKLRWTLFGINVGPTSSRTIVGPSPTTLGRSKGSALKAHTPLSSFYRNYYNNHGDWYRNQFYRQGDEHKTFVQRTCPWCYAVDSKYPVQQLFPSKKTAN
ncbi:unnamed protein product [Angiostrongylus costaricensis]|uniref:ULP_PROTEASE domain-containing protein n=1 Tax=Angiostrongylus costaricensis TaxID=334426 RepID=A0A158PH48_ANGCS|nr:unnamed protein product [Angiostrongylus costaricensis]